MNAIEGYALQIETALEFDRAIEVVTEKLKAKGFGILTEIDVTKTLKTKINQDFKPYRILGACNPPFAHRVLSENNNIGVFLPCNVIVEEHEDGTVEVAAVDPIASMQAVSNPSLGEVATEIQAKLRKVIEEL